MSKTRKAIATRKRTRQQIFIARPTVFQTRSSPEWKNVDTVLTDFALVTPASTFTAGQLLSGIAAGTGNQTRIGRKVTFRSFQVRFHMGNQAGTGVGATGSPMRMLVVYDKQPNGALALIGDVLTANDFAGLFNLNNADRFVIIHDHVYQIDSSTPTTGQFYRKIALDAIYPTGAAGIADINSGSIVMFLCNTGVTAPVINLQARLRYTDS